MKKEPDSVRRKGELNAKTCLDALNEAFGEVPAPTASPLYRSNGLDAGHLVRNWQGQTRRTLADPQTPLNGTGEDLDYMSLDWLFYFLPGLMERTLADPKRMDEIIVCKLIDLLLNDEGSQPAATLLSRLSKPQMHALHSWVTWIGINIKSFFLPEYSYRQRIKALRRKLRPPIK